MDGSLLRTDTLHESFADILFRRPLALLATAPALLRGRAHFKRRLSALAGCDWRHAPLREDFVAYLAQQRSAGRTLHLVTAADQSVADAVAARVGLFDTVHGSDGTRNLKGAHKLAFIRETFGGPFCYAGDCGADIALWRHADGIILAGASPSTARTARRLGPPIEAEFPDRGSRGKAWLEGLRLHQWAKNTLIFAPFFLSHSFAQPELLLHVLLGFLILGVVASSTYVINDIADLDADRQHWKKRARPFARGALPIWQGVLFAPVAIAFSIGAAFALEPGFALLLLFYLAMTLSYSFGLKRIPILDLVMIGGLFTLRLAMGSVLVGVEFSTWLLTFSMFLFFSLSVAKRHVEILKSEQRGDTARLPGRGYQVGDGALTVSLGVSSAVVSVFILVLYLMEDVILGGTYSDPRFLWAVPVAIGLWLGRVWMLAHRGQMDHDPVAFAIGDRTSLALGVLVGASFLLASL